MPEGTEDKLAQCFRTLDEAIATVAQEEFESLRRGHRSAYVTTQVARALGELKRLRQPRGAPPSYDDPWVVLCYVLWYQPAQTFLALKCLERLARLRSHERLHIVDFGCGALATEMAVDIALATGYLDSSAREPSDVMVDSLDSSATMIRFGEAISRELLNSISWPGDESDIWSERNLVDASDWNFTEVGDFVDTWLMGLHAVYDQSIDSAQSQVAAIDELVGADCILLTTHSLKASLLRRVLPKDESSRIIRLSAAKIERESLPSMDRIKEMRMEIRRFAVGSKLPDSHSDDIALVRSYMGGVPDLFQSIDRVSCRLHAREEDQG